MVATGQVLMTCVSVGLYGGYLTASSVGRSPWPSGRRPWPTYVWMHVVMIRRRRSSASGHEWRCVAFGHQRTVCRPLVAGEPETRCASR